MTTHEGNYDWKEVDGKGNDTADDANADDYQHDADTQTRRTRTYRRFFVVV
jgi:hypothetical protein